MSYVDAGYPVAQIKRPKRYPVAQIKWPNGTPWHKSEAANGTPWHKSKGTSWHKLEKALCVLELRQTVPRGTNRSGRA
jgi:hypothetical protein